MIKKIILALLLSISSAQAAYTPIGGTNGNIQYNNNGSFGGLSVVPVDKGGTGASTIPSAWYNLSGGGSYGAETSYIAYCAYKGLNCTTGDQTTNLQNFFLDSQIVFYSLGGFTTIDLAGGGNRTVKAVVEPNSYTISSPLVCPEHVECNIKAILKADSSGSIISPCADVNWDGSDCHALNTLYQPMIIAAYGAHLDDILLIHKKKTSTTLVC